MCVKSIILNNQGFRTTRMLRRSHNVKKYCWRDRTNLCM